MAFFHLKNFWASQYDIIQFEELGTTSLDDLIDAIASFELSSHVESLQFFIMMPLQCHDHFSLVSYLSPPTMFLPLKGYSTCYSTTHLY